MTIQLFTHDTQPHFEEIASYGVEWTKSLNGVVLFALLTYGGWWLSELSISEMALLGWITLGFGVLGTVYASYMAVKLYLYRSCLWELKINPTGFLINFRYRDSVSNRSSPGVLFLPFGDVEWIRQREFVHYSPKEEGPGYEAPISHYYLEMGTKEPISKTVRAAIRKEIHTNIGKGWLVRMESRRVPIVTLGSNLLRVPWSLDENDATMFSTIKASVDIRQPVKSIRRVHTTKLDDSAQIIEEDMNIALGQVTGNIDYKWLKLLKRDELRFITGGPKWDPNADVILMSGEIPKDRTYVLRVIGFFLSLLLIVWMIYRHSGYWPQ